MENKQTKPWPGNQRLGMRPFPSFDPRPGCHAAGGSWALWGSEPPPLPSLGSRAG